MLAGIWLIVSLVLAAGGVGHGAASNTVVSALVPSATTLDISGCATGTANVTDFGVVMPATSSVTSSDCVVGFGSSNDSSSLRLGQQDGIGTAMTGPHGRLDPSFGTAAGYTRTAIGPTVDETFAVALQSDGKLLAVGDTYNGSTWDMGLARYNADGTLDTTYGGGDGVATLDIADDSARGVVPTADGGAVIAGDRYNGSEWDVVIAKFDANGALDTTFGSGAGFVVTDVGLHDMVSALLEHQGKLLAIGSNGQPVAVRYNADGSLDGTFGTGGMSNPTFGTSNVVRAAVVDASDRIVVAGHTSGSGNDDFFVARLTPVGALDTTFGGGTGYARTELSGVNDIGHGAGVLSDGRIVVAGASSLGGTGAVGLAAYTSAGVLDTSGFGGGTGFVRSTFGSGASKALALLVLPNDRVLVAGDAYDPAGDRDVLLAQYLPTGAADSGGFGTGGRTITRIAGSHDDAEALLQQPDGKLVATGDLGYDFAIYRYAPEQVADYSDLAAAGDTDWSTGANMFGVCLRSVGAGTTAVWGVDAACGADDGTPWQPVPPTTGAATAEVAEGASGTATASASLRFGLRTSTSQPPGQYAAPLTVEVLAPAT